MNTLKVSEIFHSLQGEGPFMGKPATFIRLYGCVEPFCKWCDTRYAYQGQDYDKMTVDNIIHKVQSYKTELVVITGGEPLLQWSSALKQLEEDLIKKGCPIQYETSGKVKIPKNAATYIVCSPKKTDGIWCFDEDNLDQVDAYKFVVINQDLSDIHEFIRTHKIPRHKVWLMPLGANQSQQMNQMQRIWNLAIENGYNFSPRLHILAFDTKTGV